MSKFLVILGLLIGFTAQAQETVTLSKRNTIVMNQEFDSDTVAVVAQQALELHSSLPAGVPINLVLDSPGGSIFAGLELIRNLNSLGRRINTISLFAASMGFQTAQGINGSRYIVKDGTLMSHKAKGGFQGEFPGQLDSRYQYVLGVVTDMNKVAVSRTAGKMTLAQYDALIENEYWCTGQRCVDKGFADAVTNVRCDASLSGTTTKNLNLGGFFGIALSAGVVFSDCPTITGPLAVKIKVDGEDYNKVVRKLNRDQKEKVAEVARSLTSKLTARDRKVTFYTELNKR